MLPLTRVLAFTLCGSAGFIVSRGLTPSPASRPALSAATSTPAPQEELAPPPEGESAFLSEWNRFRQEHSGEDLSANYLAVKDLKDSFRRRAFRAALIAEWVTTDPKTALSFLQQKDSGQTNSFIREWMRVDPNGAITTLLAGGEKAKAGLRAVLNDVARVAPARLAEVVSALPKAENRFDSTAQDAFAILGAKDPEAAKAAAESVTGPMRAQALAGVAKAWGEKDGPAAIAWAQGMPAGEARDGVLKGALIGWAKTDPVAALDKIDLAPPGGDESYYASDVGAQVLREAGKKDWDTTLKWLQEHPGKLGRSSFSGLEGVISQRLNTDMAGTLRSLSQSGIPGVDSMLGNSLLNDGYSQRDNLWAWLDQQPSTAFTKSARSSLMNAIGWKDPDLGLEFIERLEDSPENRELVQQGVRSLINGGSQIDRLDGLLAKASPKTRPYLLEAGLEYGLNYSSGSQQALDFKPEVWLSRLEELPPERRSNAYSGIAQTWAASDPEAALKWATGLQDSTQRQQAFMGAVSSWVRSDVYEAAAWVDKLPPGSDRDRAAQSLANSISMTQPETAWTWALSIGNEDSRRSSLQFAYWGLQKKDPAIAEQMLKSANLPEAQMEALRKSRSPY